MNKFEKEKKVIELHKEGKTLKEISIEVHMSFRDIAKIIKAYDKKVSLENQKRQENNQLNHKSIKKLSLSSRAFKLFREGKKSIDVAIDLDIPYEKAKKFWSQFLRLTRMYECYELYLVCGYDIPNLLAINNFLKRNNVSGNNIVNTLRTANDFNNLNQTYHNLKTEIKDLEQRRNYLLDYSPSSPYSLQPLPLNKPNYSY